MEVFSTIFYKVVPLYITIALGFIAGKLLKVDRSSIASTLFYLISPLVFFYSIAKAPIDVSVITLALITFLIASFIGWIFYLAGGLVWKDSTRNILGFAAGNANTGFFGLPIALEIFSDQLVSVFITAMIGIVIFENTVGFYLTARSTSTVKECIARIVKLPSLYAFFLGLIVSYFNLKIPGIFTNLFMDIRSTYTTLGMMVIGIGLAGIQGFKIDYIFILFAFIAKFFFWPLITFALIFIDNKFFHFYSKDIYNVMILISIVPLASNTVIMASVLKAQPEKAATAVLAGVIFALLYVPMMVSYFII
jgi:predicted permease